MNVGRKRGKGRTIHRFESLCGFIFYFLFIIHIHTFPDIYSYLPEHDMTYIHTYPNITHWNRSSLTEIELAHWNRAHSLNHWNSALTDSIHLPRLLVVVVFLLPSWSLLCAWIEYRVRWFTTRSFSGFWPKIIQKIRRFVVLAFSCNPWSVDYYYSLKPVRANIISRKTARPFSRCRASRKKMKMGQPRNRRRSRKPTEISALSHKIKKQQKAKHNNDKFYYYNYYYYYYYYYFKQYKLWN